MKITKLLILTCISLCLILAFVGCGSNDNEQTDAPKTSGKTITLNVYNWGEYISDGFEGCPDVNAMFEEYYYNKYGVKLVVNYTTYATNEDMYSKLSSGA